MKTALKENHVYIEKVIAQSSQSSYTYVMMNMKILAVVTQPYIYQVPKRAHGLLDNGKDRKRASKRKWNDRDYHIQDRKYVSHIWVKMSCATNQF